MDHAGMAQDREDLARYRAGLPPLQRKEYYVTRILTAEEVNKAAHAALVKAVTKLKRKKK